MDKISVIVPVYKVAEYLDECVESIVNQTYRNLEIILVDDGSPDACPDMCDAWAKKDDRIKVIHKANGGLSDARNKGYLEASGDLISFVDSDDCLNINMYTVLYECMVADACDIVVCDIVNFNDSKPNDEMVDFLESFDLLNTVEAMSELIEDGKVKHVVWNKLYKKTVIGQVLFEEGKYHEDVYWTYQVIGSASRIGVADFAGYYYRQRASSIMGETYSKKRLDAVEAKEMRQQYLMQRFPELKIKGLTDLYFTCMYHGQQAILNKQDVNVDEVMKYLKATLKLHKLRFNDIKHHSFKTKVSIIAARIALKMTCRLRNKLGIGVS